MIEGVPTVQALAAARRPNILWVMCDQLRWDALGCTGSGYVHTPNIDALARRGVVLRNAYCASPVCSPARASWLSGLYPHATGQWINYGPRRAGQPGCRMREDVVTIADVLAAEGYRCANAGVWHLGDDEHPQHGFEAGWITYRYHRDPDDPLVRYFADCGVANPYRGGAPEVQRYGPNTLPFGTIADPRQQRTTWTVDRAVELLDDLAGSPFFLLCGVKDPHPEMMVMPELLTRYPEAEVPLPVSRHDPLAGKPRYQHHAKFRIPPGTLDDRSYQRMFAHYYALITHIDAEMGRLLDHLQRLGLTDDTVVVFSSDHGEMLGDHGFVEKCLMYEESVRVPCIVAWPAGLPAGHEVRGAVGGVDLMPTLLELAGAPIPAPMDGHSIADALRRGTEPPPVPVLAELAEIASQDAILAPEQLAAHVMLRDGDWKYVRNRHDIDELYDLAADPREMCNLAATPAHGERLTAMRHRIAGLLRTTGPGPYAWCT
jgi:arylsulfatase A-like enzyme